MDKVQNGDTNFDQGCNPSEGLGMLNRPKGLLRPHTDSSVLSEVLQVQLDGQSFPACLIPFWFSPFASHLHQGGEGGCNHLQALGCQKSLSSRRLADPSSK